MKKRGFGGGLLVAGAALVGLFFLSRKASNESSNGAGGTGDFRVSISGGIGAIAARASLAGTATNTGSVIATFRVHLYTRAFFSELTGWQFTVDTVLEKVLNPGEVWSVSTYHDEQLGYGDAYDAWAYVHITAPVAKDIVTTPHTTKAYTVAGTFTGGPTISGRGSGLGGMGKLSGYR